MKIEKICSPSELKDGDNIKFTYTCNNVTTEVDGEVYSDSGFRLNINGLTYLISNKKKTYFNPQFSNIERIIKEERLIVESQRDIKLDTKYYKVTFERTKEPVIGLKLNDFDPKGKMLESITEIEPGLYRPQFKQT